MRFVGPGARRWHRPSWRMWQTRSTGAQAGILTEPGVLSQWVERGWRRCHTPRVQKLQLHVHQLARLKKLGAGVWFFFFFLCIFFSTCITVSWREYGLLDINHHVQSHGLPFVARARFCEINCQGWGEEKKKTFSNHKGWSNKRPTCLKELNVLFLWGLCKPFIKVKQSCQTPVVPAWGYLLLAYVSTL